MDAEGPVTDAHERYWAWWQVYFMLVAAAVAVAILGFDDHPLWRRVVAAAAIAGMVVLHTSAGRREIRRNHEGTAGVAVLAGHFALYVVAVVAAPFTTWLLFAIIPIIFQLVGLRVSIPAVVLVNLVTPAVDLVEEPGLVPTDLLIALITAAFAAWFGFWIARVIQQNTERGALIEQLEASRAEVARLSHETGIAAERARLAGEIHDTLAQGFTSIVTLLQAYDPELRDERVALAVRTAKENLAEARALVAALSPVALASGSLPDAVRRQADRFAEESGVSVAVEITGTMRDLPTPVEVVLLRAAQEALTNVRRHARAAACQVLLAYADAGVRLVVRDDGCGIVDGHADGFGLAGMRARAEQVRGTLTVSSERETGTTVQLEVPA